MEIKDGDRVVVRMLTDGGYGSPGIVGETFVGTIWTPTLVLIRGEQLNRKGKLEKANRFNYRYPVAFWIGSECTILRKIKSSVT